MQVETKKMTLALPVDVIAIIEKNSSSRTRAAFVAQCIREWGRVGILERIAESMEKQYPVEGKE